MPELKIEYWPIDRLTPYARNPRKNEHAVPKMASLIKEFGFKVPVVARSDGSVVDGHLRLMAARHLGLDTVPVVLADEWTPAQVKAFRIAVNKSAELAEWDTAMLALEIEDLKELDFDLELTGFELPELEDIMGAGTDGGTEGQTDPDAVPEAQEEPVSRLGDVWLLGRHRLMCGDSTNADDVAKLMSGKKASLLLTDPPYNVNYKGRGKKTSNGIANDNLKNDNFQFFLDDAYELIDKHTLKPASWYTFHGREWEECFKATVSKFTDIKAQIVWNKTHYNHVGGSYKRKHELCFYSIKGEEKFYGDTIFQADVEEIDWDKITPEKLKKIIDSNREAEKHGKTTVWTEKKENSALYIHPTQKPVRLLEKMVLYYLLKIILGFINRVHKHKVI